ncbi:SDR family NAD(P)-dependent oxidoreductase [Streptomyces sp. MAR4 CNY-716]
MAVTPRPSTTLPEALRLPPGRLAATTIAADAPAVRDHLVHAVPVLPGVFLLDLVLRALARTGIDPHTVELRRCRFLAPIAVSGAPRAIEVHATGATTEGGLAVVVRSRPADSTDATDATDADTAGGGDAAEWQTNCRAQVHLAEPAPAPAVDLAELLSTSTPWPGGDVEDLYAVVRDLEIRHDGFMKASGTVHVGDGYALAPMRLAPQAEPYLDSFHAHPALLDFATLVPLTLLGPGQGAGTRQAYLPVAIDVFAAPGRASAENVVYVPRRTGGGLDTETLDSDIEVRTPDGGLVARFGGFRAKRVRSVEHLTGAVTATPPPGPAPSVVRDGSDGEGGAAEPLARLVTGLVAERLGRGAVDDVDPRVGFYDLGLDSMDLLTIADTLEERLDARIYPTLLFEYPTVRALVDHLRDMGHDAAPDEPAAPAVSPQSPPPAAVGAKHGTAHAVRAGQRRDAGALDDDLAIVGLAGRYPGSDTVEELWDVLLHRRTMVTGVPTDRWADTEGWHGTFLDGVDEFDPTFFNLTAAQAELMDPHERHFLQVAWQAVEDAGHTPEGLAAETDGEVGVFAGAMWNDYVLHGLERHGVGDPRTAGSWSSSLANRVSYLLDFHGPSLTVDTACSAALTALHLAAESIRRGECRAAVVGGVNLSLHPYKYRRLAGLGLLAEDGAAHPFAGGAHGYVPGEGVGAVVLRPLGAALAAGDHVHAVLRGSAQRHSGRTAGYTVPSPDAQVRVVSAALDDAGVPVETITCLEAHATGTALGDRMELEALSQAYAARTTARGFCALGSVKGSIGHLEAAAGIAGLTRLLLGLRHRTIPAAAPPGGPSPDLDHLAGTPFWLPETAVPWPAPTDPATGLPAPRRAALSAFGAGGANVHVVVEEYVPTHRPVAPAPAGPQAVTLSTDSEGQTRELADRLSRHLRAHPELRLADVAHTLDVGRRRMRHRVTVVAGDTADLVATLEGVATGATAPAVPAVLPPPSPDARRVPLPTYPFARGRYWLSRPVTAPDQIRDAAPQGPASPAPPVPPGPPASPVAPAGTAPDRAARTFYLAPRWQPRPLPGGATGTGESWRDRTIVAFDADAERIAALRTLCGRVVQVLPGARYRQVDRDVHEVRPDDREDHRALAEALRRQDAEPAAVLHLWHLSPHAAAPANPIDLGGLLSLFPLCQAWATGRPPRLPALSIVYGYAAERERPEHAAVGGFARSLRLEQPRIALSAVRFTAAPADATVLLAEAAAIRDAASGDGAGQDGAGAGGGSGDVEVRHTEAGRGVLRFLTVEPEPVALARSGGVYLITGGAGALGRHTARRIAATPDVRVALLGRTAPGPDQARAVAELEALGARACYLSADVTDAVAVRRAVVEATGRLGPLTGVVHAAGVVADSLLVTKTPDQVHRVLDAKVRGAVHLDLATRDADLDYLLLYSSVAAVLGNTGATDYAAANRFLDAFAERREELRRAGERSGRTRAVNLPLWREGGMHPDPAVAASVLRRNGMVPLETAAGTAALEAALGETGHQVVVLHGTPERMLRTLPLAVSEDTRGDTAGARARAWPTAFTDHLTSLVARALNGHGATTGVTERLGEANFLELGITSVQLTELAGRLAQELAVEIPPTLLFRRPNVRALADHLAREHPDRFAVAEEPTGSSGSPSSPPALAPTPSPATVGPPTPRNGPDDAEPVAVIGMAGRFPGAPNVAAFWDNLATGRDLVTPVPHDRWNHGRYLDPTGERPGTTACGHGSFLDETARFDARFFGVTPAEAAGMDPQLRLLMEVMYEAADDAGAVPALRGSRTGVFVGRCFQDYAEELTRARRARGAYDVTGVSATMAANRPAFFLDLSGPSLTVDTACSSSLHALHLAVTALQRGECVTAFAAGTNLILSPSHYLESSAIGALSPTGRCFSFDARADGYVPGEAVVAVLLKPLSRALADGDPVHAVIRGTAVGHGGHASSITAPQPERQTEVLLRAWEAAGVDPRSITSLEAHGTGTALGDPIEVAAANAAFRRFTGDRGFCALGSAKSHLGHTEGAAGLVGVVKAVLSIRHALLPAMPTFQQPNPHCDLTSGALFAPREATPWQLPAGMPRRAGVSSFGFGGSYAHAVLEESPERVVPAATPADVPLFFPLSAPDEERLRAVVRRQRDFLADHPDLRLDQVSATLCRGREAMAERMVVLAGSLSELLRHFDAHLDADADRHAEGRSGADGVAVYGVAGDGEQAAAARRWAAGDPVGLPAPAVPRTALPAYPFAGERHWLLPPVEPEAPSGARLTAVEPDVPAPGTVEALAGDLAAHTAAGGFSGRRAAAGLDRLDELVVRWTRQVFGGGTPTAAGLRARLADQNRYGPLADALAAMLAGPGGAAPADTGDDPSAGDPSAALTGLLSDHPELRAWTDLAGHCLPRLPDVLSGELDVLALYFSAEAAELLPRLYGDNPLVDHYNALVARAVTDRVHALRAARPDRTVRIVEIGGGTGGTTRRVLDALAREVGQSEPPGGAAAVHYTFTDVSPAFLSQARTTFAASPVTVDPRLLDLDADFGDQGFDPASADVVVAANVVHATRRLDQSLARLRWLLDDGGVLLMQEVTRVRPCLTALIGPLPGYWVGATDPAGRLPHSPFLDVAGWRSAVARQGFGHLWAFASADLLEDTFDTSVMLCEASGPRGASRAAAAPEATPATEPPAGRRVSAGGAPGNGAATPVDATAEARERLRRILAEFFGVPAGTIDPAASFDALGMDSLSAIEVVRRLEPDFGSLPRVLLYEHTTLDALAEHLAPRLPAREAHQPAPSPAAPAAATPDAPRDPAPRQEPSRAVPVEPPAAPAAQEPVAVVGIAGRFPRSPDLATWWRHLRDGTDLVTEVPTDRFDWREVYGDPFRATGTVNSRWGAFCDQVDRFDAEFFGITPAEAALMDPQARLMLQVAWHTVEDAGHRPGDLRGSRTGVFVGATSRDYDWELHRAGRHREGHAMTGNGHCMIANRVSFQMDLRGPSEAIDTACSSSLTALHRAVGSIRTGECDAALVGGVHLFLTADAFVGLGQLGVMSPEGRCAPFDARANGMVRGEGVVGVLLKPLSQALADGDTVHALVRGSGVSHGGHVRSLTVPSPAAQAELISSVYRSAGVDPRTVSYVEAHGTGTRIGDPIELHGLRRAFGTLLGEDSRTDPAGDAADGAAEPWCGVGTVKGAMGHLEAASGLAGVAKVLLALRHGLLPPTVHFAEPNPLLEIDGTAFHVLDRARPWTSRDPVRRPRRAGVSAFGMGGSNAHVVLEEHPRHEAAPTPPTPDVAMVSARTQERLRAYARRLHDFLHGLRTEGEPEPALADVAHTLRVGRDAMRHRLAVVATTTRELTELLAAHLAGDAPPQVFLGEAPTGPDADQAGRDQDGDAGRGVSPAEGARGWVRGGAAWSPPTGGGAARRVSLPGYPFASDRHWAQPDESDLAAPGDQPADQVTADAVSVAELSELLVSLQDGALSVDEADRILGGLT